MENPNEGNAYNMPKNDWQNDEQVTNEDTNLMPGIAGNISSPTEQYAGYEATDRQDDPGNAGENSTDEDDEEEIIDDEDTEEEDDSIHKSDWGDIDPSHDGSSSNEPSFPGSGI